MKPLKELVKSRIPPQERILKEALIQVDAELPAKAENRLSLELEYVMKKAQEIHLSKEKDAFKKAVDERFGSTEQSASEVIKENFGQIQDTFMSLFQSRKARAGKTLENAVSLILRKAEVPFEPEKKSKGGGRPDFFIPNSRTYDEDPLNARILACKRTVRERWMQIIPEAQNQGIFYLLTLDADVADRTIRHMAKKRVYLVVPAKIKENSYPNSKNVITLDAFVDDCKKMLGGDHGGHYF